jgi:tRNA A-37 threonylcarbamoyl transferase component Bud32
MVREKIIQRGAEAVLIKREKHLLKRRAEKGYRIAELDEKLRKLRTRGEGRLLEKAAKLISVPKVIEVREGEKEIDMDFIVGKKLSESLDSLKSWKSVCKKIGENIAKLHDAGIIHGDLTTSNMIWVEGNSPQLNAAEEISDACSARKVNKKTVSVKSGSGRLYFIDFGLGFNNGRVEDKAVDLHLIKQALEAKHFGKWEKYFEAVLRGYEISVNYGDVMKRFEKVERRGRYKEQY